MMPVVVSVKRWVDDGRGGHWSTVPRARMSRWCLRFYTNLRFQIHARVGLLRSLVHRSAALLFRPQHWSNVVASRVAGQPVDRWLHDYSEGMKQRLDKNPWTDPLDYLAWGQGWKCGAEWAVRNRDCGNKLPVQIEDSRSITSADTIAASPDSVSASTSPQNGVVSPTLPVSSA